MAASGSHFVCSECGHSALAWTGRCPGCGEWNTLTEAKRQPSPGARRGGAAPEACPLPAPAARRGGSTAGPAGPAARPLPRRDVKAPTEDRLLTGIAELD